MPLQCELDLIQAELSHFICRSFNSLKTICYEYETNWFVSVFTWTDNKKTKQLTQRFLVQAGSLVILDVCILSRQCSEGCCSLFNQNQST